MADHSAVERLIARDGAAQALGIDIVDHGDGQARARMRVRADMIDGYGMAHGGLIFSLADTAFGCACNSLAAPTVAAAAEITFVAPAHLGDDLIAHATVRTRFGRSGIYDVTVRRGEQVIAELRGRSHQLRNLASEP